MRDLPMLRDIVDDLLSLTNPGNLFEVGILAAILFALLTFLRGTRGERMLKTLAGLLAVGYIVLRGIARGSELVRLELVLDAIFQASVVALVVIFQPELRRVLSQKVGGRFFASNVPGHEIVSELLAAAARLSKTKTGALIALQREDSLGEFVEKGTALEAKVDGRLLRTIFWPGTPLHDGAVIIQNGRVAAGECLLPVSQNPDLPKSLGTRHRAGLGLSEQTDAVVLIVSEETGAISIAVGGALHRNLDRDALSKLLEELYLVREEENPSPDPSGGLLPEHPPLDDELAPTESTAGRTSRISRRGTAV